MRYLFLMTAAGTILFVLYGIWILIFGRCLNHGMKYKALVIVLLTHMVPLVGLKVWYRWFLELLSQKQVVQQSDLLVAMADISTAAENYMTPNFKWSILVAVIWTSITVLILLSKCTRYMLKRINLNKVSKSCHCEVGANIVEQLKPRYRIKRPIEVLQVDGERTPYTMGVFRPIIVLYGEFTESEMTYVLKHELTHIARGDVLFKLFLELVCGLYWLNLSLYLFAKHFNNECEVSCDERVVLDCTEEERREYSKLLEKYLHSGKRNKMRTAFADDYDNIEERINEIMNIRKMKRWQKIIVAGVFAVFMMTDSLVALAYPDVYHVEDEVVKVYGVNSAEEVAAGSGIFICDDIEDGEHGYRKPIFEVIYDVEFIDEEGTIIPVNLAQPFVFCPSHSWVSGYLQTHTKSDDGGCTVREYKSRLCTICNTIVMESLYATHTYAICPHD